MNETTQAIEAEQAVLGSILIDSSCIRDVAEKLRESDFSLVHNQEIFRVLTEMDLNGKPIDGLTVAEALKKNKIGDEKSTRLYLANLMEITPTSANVMEYAQIVQDCSRRRCLRTALQRGLEALDYGEAEETVSSGVEAALSETSGRAASDLLTPKEQVNVFYDHRERIDDGKTPYVRTGFPQIDELLGGGLVNEGLYFLAARPGVGKTALALVISEYVATHWGDVVFISMEMSTEQITSRRVASLSGIKSNLILTQKLTESEYKNVAQAASEIAKTPMYVTAGRALSAARITSISRAHKKCKLVVVDHFSLILLPGKQPTHVEYAAVAHALKRLAQAMKAPVLCLAQLNRESEQRTSKRPILSDLRATGAAEEDADGVLLLHRPDYYSNEKKDDVAPVIMEVNLAKNRHGATGKVDLSFYLGNNRFREKFVK